MFLADLAPGPAIAVILAIGVGAQLLTARWSIPSILVLLPAGMAVGSVLDPDELFSRELLFPLVSLGVGILLFEGGFGLRWHQIGRNRGPIIRLVTVGVLVTWILGALAVWLFLDVSMSLTLLIAAILTVSGPTVVIPLLRAARPREPSASILHWEGILIDPIGATLAIVVLDAILEERGAAQSILRVLTTAVSGITVGLGMAFLLGYAMYKHLIPDRLDVPATLTTVVGAFAIANELRPEAGLFATTVLGLALANQRRVGMAHISGFNESLGTIVLGALFVVLGARVTVEDIESEFWPTLAICAVLVLIARPLAVALSTLGTGIPRADRRFMAWMAPRGIVAAAVSSLFAFELENHDIDPGPLVPVVFTVVVVTVLLYGITATPVANRLRIRRADSGGLLIIGGQPWALDLADLVAQEEATVLVVTPNDDAVYEASSRGLLVFTGRLDSDDLDDAIEAAGVSSALALSAAEHLNSYGIARLAEHLGRARVFHFPHQASDGEKQAGADLPVIGRRILPPSITHAEIAERYEAGDAFVVRRGSLEPDDNVLLTIDEKRRVTLIEGNTDIDDGEVAVVIPRVSELMAEEPGDGFVDEHPVGETTETE